MLLDMECIHFGLVLHLFHSQVLCIAVVWTSESGTPDSWCDDAIGSNLDGLTVVRTARALSRQYAQHLHHHISSLRASDKVARLEREG